MNPQNTKCHRSPKITFFRHFSVTKAIHTCTLAKFEKISIVLFSTPLLDFYRRLLLSKVLESVVDTTSAKEFQELSSCFSEIHLKYTCFHTCLIHP